MKLVLISDTHEKHEQLSVPDGDVLIFAGDMSINGEIDKIKDFANWFKRQTHKYKIFIAGNHDKLFEKALPAALKPFFPDSMNHRDLNSDGVPYTFVTSEEGLYYLEDDYVVIENKMFYGSPWTPSFGYGWVFNADLEKMDQVSKAIPSEVDVLITHGPPRFILDKTLEGDFVGSVPQSLEVRNRAQPQIHVFGHIHEGYGHAVENGINYYNASVLDRAYRVANKPWEVEI